MVDVGGRMIGVSSRRGMPILTLIVWLIVGCCSVAIADPAGNAVQAVSVAAGSAASMAGPTRSAVGTQGLRVSLQGATDDLSAVLTNDSTTTCVVPDTILGSIRFVAVSQRGTSIPPVSLPSSFDETAGEYLAAHQHSLVPGAALRVPIREIAGGPTGTELESLQWSSDGTSTDDLYPVDNSVPLALTVDYDEPLIAPGAVPSCSVQAPVSTSVTALAADVTSGSSHQLWWWGGAVVIVLILLLVGILLLRRRRSRTTRVAAVVLVGFLLSAIGVESAPHAVATTSVDGDVADEYASCAKIFDAPGGDPAGILPSLNAAGVRITIQSSNGDANHELAAGDGQSIILWNVSDRHQYAGGGGFSDPCTALYHEMFHAYQDSHGGQNHAHCWSAGPNGTEVDSGIPTNEVLATRAQNQLRAVLGLPQRTAYGDTPLPTGNCLPPPKNPPKPGCTGAGCGSTNGDPHLQTFDGARYDFQAVGEFVAAVDPRDDFQIQVRQQALSVSATVAVNTAVAMSVSGDRVQVDKGTTAPVVTIEGPDGRGRLDTAARTTLPHGGTVSAVTSWTGPLITVTWPDGSSAWVDQIGRWGLRLQIQPARSHASRLRGLLGDFDGQPADDIRTSGGTELTRTSSAASYRNLADSWRITDARSLFFYAPGTSTATFTDRSFPHGAATADQIPNLAGAHTVCVEAGISDPVSLTDCELDVGLTGDPVFARLATPATPITTAAGDISPDGAAVTVGISEPDQVATLAFHGDAGQQILVDISKSTLPDQCGSPELVDPAGHVLNDGCIIGGHGVIDGTTLPSTGQYSIVLRGSSHRTGTATLSVILDHNQEQTIDLDAPAVDAIIAQPGATSRFSFHGTRGSKVFVELSASTLSDQCGAFSVEDAADRQIRTGCAIDGVGDIDTMTLPADGVYSVVIDPSAVDTGRISVRLLSVHDQRGSITAGGPPVQATVGPGAIAQFAFEGTAGQLLTVTATSSTLPDGCPLELVAPDGDDAGSGCIIHGTGGISKAVLPTTGPYLVTVDPGGADAGSTLLQLTSG